MTGSGGTRSEITPAVITPLGVPSATEYTGMCLLRARAAPSSGDSLPRVCAPSESRRIAIGGESGAAGSAASEEAPAGPGASSSTPRAIASPIAVPCPGAPAKPSASSTIWRSRVSGAATETVDENVTRPTRSRFGSSETNVRMAPSAAASRVGLTSSAAIEPDMSTASTIDAGSRATATRAWGRARAASAQVNASVAHAAGVYVRQRGRRGMTVASSGRFVKCTA